MPTALRQTGGDLPDAVNKARMGFQLRIKVHAFCAYAHCDRAAQRSQAQWYRRFTQRGKVVSSASKGEGRRFERNVANR